MIHDHYTDTAPFYPPPMHPPPLSNMRDIGPRAGGRARLLYM